MISHTTFAQYSPEYWEKRCGIPSASNFDRIMTPKTLKPSASQEDYIAELISDRKCQTPNFFTDRPMTKAMADGTDIEPEARRFYEYKRRVEVQQVGGIQTDDLTLWASPDGLVNGEGGLELKGPTRKVHTKYLMAGAVVPPDYLCQVHGSLIVSGLPWWDFMSYAPGLPPLIVRVYENEFTAALRECLKVFLDKYRAAWDAFERIGGELLA